MARMHARRKGTSGSRRPIATEAPSWQGLSKKEVQAKVIELSKAGHGTAKIGLILRDQHAVPSVKLATGQSILAILKDNKAAPGLPEDIANLIHKAINLIEHCTDKPQDLHNARGLALTEAKIRRLAKYYQHTGALAADWKYSRKQAKLLVE